MMRVALLLLAAAADALQIGAPMGRRAAVVGAGALLASWRTPATARQLTADERASILKRADEGKLVTDMAVARARDSALFDGKDATCFELKKIVDIDTAATKEERKALDAAKFAAKFEKENGGSEQAVKLAEAKVGEIKAISIKLDQAISSLNLDAAQKCGVL